MDISVLAQQIPSQTPLDCTLAICSIISTHSFLIFFFPFHVRSLVFPRWKSYEPLLDWEITLRRECRAQECWRPC